MEIKNVENEVKNNYPKQEDISNKTLKKSIPKKWKILGISAIAISLISGVTLVEQLIYNRTAGDIISPGVSLMDQQRVEMFNYKFKDYVGNQSGARVKALISQIIATNNALYPEEMPERIVSFNGKTEENDLIKERKAIIIDKIYNVEFSYNAETNLIDSITAK